MVRQGTGAYKIKDQVFYLLQTYPPAEFVCLLRGMGVFDELARVN